LVVVLLLVALTATPLGRWMSLWSLLATEQLFQILRWV